MNPRVLPVDLKVVHLEAKSFQSRYTDTGEPQRDVSVFFYISYVYPVYADGLFI